MVPSLSEEMVTDEARGYVLDFTVQLMEGQNTNQSLGNAQNHFSAGSGPDVMIPASSVPAFYNESSGEILDRSTESQHLSNSRAPGLPETVQWPSSSASEQDPLFGAFETEYQKPIQDESPECNHGPAFKKHFHNTDEAGGLHSNANWSPETQLKAFVPSDQDFFEVALTPPVVDSDAPHDVIDGHQGFQRHTTVDAAAGCTTSANVVYVSKWNQASLEWRQTDTYKDLSSRTMTNDFPFENYALYIDFEKRELLCCVDSDLQIQMFDRKKREWVQDNIKRHIPHVKSGSRILTTYILGYGGLIFLFSEQEVAGDKLLCFHKFNPDAFEDGSLWEEISSMATMTTTFRGGSGDHLYPNFTVDQPSSAIMVGFDSGSTFVFSEQESGKKKFLCIQQSELRADGGVHWKVVLWRERKRHRASNWIDQEITFYLNAMAEARDAGKDGKVVWEHVSGRLKEAGFKRGAQGCEDEWGTLLKRITYIQTHVRKNSLSGPSNSWDSVWNKTQDQSLAECKLRGMPGRMTWEWYSMIEKIHEKKPWKSKSALGKSNKSHGMPSKSSSFSKESSITSASPSGLTSNVNLPLAPLASTSPLRTSVSLDPGVEGLGVSNALVSEVKALTDFLLQGRQNMSNSEIYEVKCQALQLKRTELEHKIEVEKNKRHKIED